MEEKRLDDLIDKKDFKELLKIIRAKDKVALKNFLNESVRAKSLEQKGVLADYLYYVLCHKYKIE